MLSPCQLFKSGSSTSPDKYHSTSDRISQLPDEILELILKNLTLRDAVRTSVLSHGWKHIPSILSKLDFHLENVFDLSAKSWNVTEIFVTSVNQFIDSYQGTHIIFFGVSFCLGSNFNDDINRWVKFAIKMGVAELYLNLWCSEVSQPPMAGKYALKRDVFDGAEIKIKKLCLIRCILGPNLFTSQLNSVEHLVLDCIPLVEHDNRNIFSCLVNLRILKFQSCILPEKIYLGSLHLLKFFSVSNCSGINNIELSNANLLRLKCDSSYFVKLDMNKVPKLKYFRHQQATGNQLHSIFSYHPQHFPNLKTLSVSSGSAWRKYIPESLTIFSSVTELKLFFYKHTKFDILKMVSILKAFPSLRKLDLLTSCSHDLNQSSLDLGNYSHRSLEDVAFRGFDETPMQMKFAIYLLNLALKRLVITKKLKNQEWDESGRQKVYEELQQFSKDTVLIVQ